jgi:hypothetical protein
MPRPSGVTSSTSVSAWLSAQQTNQLAVLEVAEARLPRPLSLVSHFVFLIFCSLELSVLFSRSLPASCSVFFFDLTSFTTITAPDYSTTIILSSV